MKKLERLEKDHYEYANILAQLITQPRTNSQLVDLIKTIIDYLKYSGDELHKYNEYIDAFVGFMSKLP